MGTVVNTVYIIFVSIALLLWLIAFTSTNVKEKRLKFRVSHMKKLTGKVVNLWSVEPKNGLKQYKFTCVIENGTENPIHVRVRENFTDRVHYGYSISEKPAYGDEFNILYDSKKKEYFIEDDIVAETKSFRFYYGFYTGLALIAIMFLSLVRIGISMKFGI